MEPQRIELESKIAMLERTVDALSGELQEHRKQIESLLATVQVLTDQLRKKSGGDDLEPHDTKPPHWG